MAAIAGASLGFLWFNYCQHRYLWVVSLSLTVFWVVLLNDSSRVSLYRHGRLFIIETLSVIIQVGSFRLRGKRVFKMAPIHHHYELKGW